MEDSNKRTPRTWGEVTEKLRERRKVVQEQNGRLRELINNSRDDDIDC